MSFLTIVVGDYDYIWKTARTLELSITIEDPLTPILAPSIKVSVASNSLLVNSSVVDRIGSFTAVSLSLLGNWGTSIPKLLKAEASGSSDNSIMSPGDSVTLYFDQVGFFLLAFVESFVQLRRCLSMKTRVTQITIYMGIEEA